MPFGEITAGTKTFAPREPGTYSDTTAAFGMPQSEFRIRGARPSKDGVTRGTVTRIYEVDVNMGDDTVRKNAVATLSLAVPTDGSVPLASVDALIRQISDFLTEETLSRFLQGES